MAVSIDAGAGAGAVADAETADDSHCLRASRGVSSLADTAQAQTAEDDSRPADDTSCSYHGLCLEKQKTEHIFNTRNNFGYKLEHRFSGLGSAHGLFSGDPNYSKSRESHQANPLKSLP